MGTRRHLKILAVRPGPQFSVEDVANGWIKGLRANGHEVIDFDLGLRLDFFKSAFSAIRGLNEDGLENFTLEEAAMNAAVTLEGSCWEHQPEMILIFTGYYLPPEFYDIARRNGHKVVLMCTESPYEDDRQLLQAYHCDAVILNDTRNIEKFNEICPTYYFGHGFDPEVHYPGEGNPDYLSEFCFVGTGFPQRIEFFEKMDWTTINAAFAGYWQATKPESPLRELLVHDIDDCLENSEAAAMYRSSLISANLYRKEKNANGNHDGHSCGPREIEMAACGLFFLRESRPESDSLFPMLPTFTSPGDLQDQIYFWLNNFEERQLRATQALEAVQHRTFERLAKEFTEQIINQPIKEKQLWHV